MANHKESAQLKAIIVSLIFTLLGVAFLAISFPFWPEWPGQFARALAIALLTSGLIGWASHFTLRRSFQHQLHQIVSDALSEQLAGLSQLKGMGITEVFPALPPDRVANELKISKKTVRVLDTFISDPNFLLESIEEAAAHGAKVQVLILHRESHSAKTRSRDLGYKEAFVPTYLDTNRALLLDLVDRYPNAIEAKTYDALPSTAHICRG
ncbi:MULTISPECIES: hypothetical protein [unclassified Nonomuraea]|uniref:hypothetical protein n=1 Tax=unclassified Nonomuraea TaxID=2593643 RepID=UPI0033E4C653